MKIINFKDPRYIGIVLLTLCIILISGALKAQAVQPQNQEEDQPVLILTALRGNPQQGGGETQDYTIASGDIVFLKVSQSNDTGNKPKIDVVYETQMNKLASQISQKVTNMEQLKSEYNTEIFPAFQPDLELDRQAQAADLRRLELERERIESDHRIKESERKMREAAARPAPTTQARGVNVQANVEDNNISFVITPKGLKSDNTIETTIQAPMGKWVKILGKEDTDGSELWIKAELAPEQ